MNCARELSDAIAAIVLTSAACSFVACWAGAFFGRASYHCLDWFVLRRLRSWKRYQRAVGRLFS